MISRPAILLESYIQQSSKKFPFFVEFYEYFVLVCLRSWNIFVARMLLDMLAILTFQLPKMPNFQISIIDFFPSIALILWNEWANGRVTNENLK